MSTCSMCRKPTEDMEDFLLEDKPICPNCAKQIDVIMSSTDKTSVKKAFNYIYTCAQQATDKEVAEYLNDILENNTAVMEELGIKEEKKRRESPVVFNEQTDYFEDRSENNTSGSAAAKFCRVLAILTWIGGLAIAILNAEVSQINSNYNIETTFSFSAFLTNLVIYGITGAALFCFAELLDNVQSIANKTSELLKLTKNGKKQ